VCIFYCAGGKFGEVAEVFLTEKHSPDTGVGSTGRCTCASGEVSDSGACEPSTTDADTGRGQDTVRLFGGA